MELSPIQAKRSSGVISYPQSSRLSWKKQLPAPAANSNSPTRCAIYFKQERMWSYVYKAAYDNRRVNSAS